MHFYNNRNLIIAKFFQWELMVINFQLGMMCHEHPEKCVQTLYIFFVLSSCAGKANMLSKELPQAVSQPCDASRHQFFGKQCHNLMLMSQARSRHLYLRNTGFSVS